MKAEREIEEKLKEGKRRRRNEIKEKQKKTRYNTIWSRLSYWVDD